MSANLQLPKKQDQHPVHPDSTFENKPQSLSRNATWNVGSTGVSMVLLFFLAPYLIHHLGVENYGIYRFLGTISGMLGLANLGLGEATLRYVALYASQTDLVGINRVFRATFFVTLITGSLATLAAIAAAPWIISSLKFSHLDVRFGVYLLQLTAISFWIRFIAGTFLSIPQALLRYDLYCQIVIFESVLRAVGCIVVVLMAWGLEGLIYLNLFLSLFFLVMVVVASKRLIAGLVVWRFPSREGIREVFGYGVYAFASQLVGMGWQYTDRILLGIFVSAGAIAYFSVPQDLVMRLLTLIAAAPAAVLMPKFAGVVNNDRLKQLYLQATSLFLCLSIIVFVPLAVFIKDFLSLWISPEFARQSGLIALLFCASSIIRGAFLPYEALFRGIGRPQYYLVIITLSSLTVLGMGLLLIPKLGLMGAGYAICITPLLGIAAVAFTLAYVLKVRTLFLPIKLFVIPTILGFACLGGGLWMRSLYYGDLGWFVMILGAVIIFFLTVTMLVIYEFTICRKEDDFMFMRKLVRLLPKGILAHGNIT